MPTVRGLIFVGLSLRSNQLSEVSANCWHWNKRWKSVEGGSANSLEVRWLWKGGKVALLLSFSSGECLKLHSEEFEREIAAELRATGDGGVWKLRGWWSVGIQKHSWVSGRISRFTVLNDSCIEMWIQSGIFHRGWWACWEPFGNGYVFLRSSQLRRVVLCRLWRSDVSSGIVRTSLSSKAGETTEETQGILSK
jgi:hypothetical protein